MHFNSFPDDINHSIHAAAATAAKSLQSCPTLCDTMDCSLPGYSVHGIFQARVLEWVVVGWYKFRIDITVSE